MNILITGAGGFIGSHLTDSQLNMQHHVRAVDVDLTRLSHAANHSNLELVQADLTDEETVRCITAGIDVVYHLASAHLDVSLTDEHYRMVNVVATMNLLQSAQKAGVGRFVHCSSVGVIGDVERPPANENSDCHPTNIYEQTKLEGEQAVQHFARQNAYPVVIARPAWVYGPRCPRTEKLIRTIAKRRFVIFGNGSNLRHPIFISDAVHGLRLCAEATAPPGEIFILAGERAVPVTEVVENISRTLGIRPPRIHLPIALGMVGGIGLELIFKIFKRRPPFSRRSLDFFLKHNAYDIRKAERELNFHPQVDLPSGIKMSIEWQKGLAKAIRS